MPKATSWRSPSVPANGPDRDTLPTRDDGKQQWPGLRFAILDGAFSAERCPDWCTIPGMHSSVGEKGPDRKGFVVLERRWAVERTFGWPSRWVGFHRERAGRLEVVAGRPACVASLMAANVLYNPA